MAKATKCHARRCPRCAQAECVAEHDDERIGNASAHGQSTAVRAPHRGSSRWQSVSRRSSITKLKYRSSVTL